DGVEGAEAAHGRLDRRAHLLGAGDVGGREDRPLAELTRHVRPRRAGQVQEDHVAAVRHEALGGGATQPGGAACDQRRRSLDPHRAASSLSPRRERSSGPWAASGARATIAEGGLTVNGRDAYLTAPAVSPDT